MGRRTEEVRGTRPVSAAPRPRHHRAGWFGARTATGPCCSVPAGAGEASVLPHPHPRPRTHPKRSLSIGLILVLHPVESAQSKNRCLLREVHHGVGGAGPRRSQSWGGAAPDMDGSARQVCLTGFIQNTAGNRNHVQVTDRHASRLGQQGAVPGNPAPAHGSHAADRSPQHHGRCVPATSAALLHVKLRNRRGHGRTDGRTDGHLTVPCSHCLSKNTPQDRLGSFQGRRGIPGKQVAVRVWSGEGDWLVSSGHTVNS